MTKRRPSQDMQPPPRSNPVAKFAHHYNKAQVFADKHRYQRNKKHRGQEPFAIVFEEKIAKGSSASKRVFQGLLTL